MELGFFTQATMILLGFERNNANAAPTVSQNQVLSKMLSAFASEPVTDKEALKQPRTNPTNKMLLPRRCPQAGIGFNDTLGDSMSS